VEVSESHEAKVGQITVRRALPRAAHRTVGPWCFADHMGPVMVTERSGLDIGPHPHMGLQTVTWLIEGTALHRDSLGTEQLIAAGELNLMSAGRGVSHSEEATGDYSGRLEGIQLWIAQPESTRHSAAAFEHHHELPALDLDEGRACVLIGEFAGSTSPARHDSELVGVELDLIAPVTLPLRADFEHALIVLDGALRVDGQPLTPGHLGYLGLGREEIAIDVIERTRAMLVGGTPFDEPVVMWWNFVGRSREEFVEAYDSWSSDDGRFGTVRSELERVTTVPPPPGLR
jgi:redox-sensitive bicupin YhaK (pirin superfamily)